MNHKTEISVEEIAQITEQNVGVVELNDDMLQLVAGGTLQPTLGFIPGTNKRACPLP